MGQKTSWGASAIYSESSIRSPCLGSALTAWPSLAELATHRESEGTKCGSAWRENISCKKNDAQKSNRSSMISKSNIIGPMPFASNRAKKDMCGQKLQKPGPRPQTPKQRFAGNLHWPRCRPPRAPPTVYGPNPMRSRLPVKGKRKRTGWAQACAVPSDGRDSRGLETSNSGRLHILAVGTARN